MEVVLYYQYKDKDTNDKWGMVGGGLHGHGVGWGRKWHGGVIHRGGDGEYGLHKLLRQE